MKQRNTCLALLLAGTALACSDGPPGGGSTSPVGDGRIQSEAASNESPGEAQSLGAVGPGGSLRVSGDVTAFDTDQFDTYRFEAAGDTSVRFELATQGSTADLDLWLADAAGVVRERFESPAAGVESGLVDLAAGEVALLVVIAADADSDYLLTITGR